MSDASRVLAASPVVGPSAYQAFPLPGGAALHQSASSRPPAGPPEPLRVPWGLKPMGSAACGVDRLADGRTRYWIRHAPMKGVTPRMLAWWFAHLEGDAMVEGVRVDRYRLWHPYDHVRAGYAKRLPDGSVGPGAVLFLREMLGANPAYTVDVRSVIEKLDEEGFVHCPIFHGVPGLVRMEYTFAPGPEGAVFQNCLVFGARSRVGRWMHPLLERVAFPPAKGQAWLRHNIEEVGMLENFLPSLYRQETGLAD